MQLVADKLKQIWALVEELHEEIYDLQPGEKREVGLNLVGYIKNDIRFISHKFGADLNGN